MPWWKSLRKYFNLKLFVYVICLCLPFVLSPLAVSSQKEAKCSYVILLVASYWLLEPVHIAATALLPVVLFPLLDVVGSADICLNYLKESFMMFIGGLLMAISVEECKLHERISLKILLLMGSDIKWLMLGFMMTTAFLSMWISNTATTAMMIPIVEAVYKKISIPVSNSILLEENAVRSVSDVSYQENEEKDNEEIQHNEDSHQRNPIVKTALLLCVCYAANIGGTGSLTGTGTNLVIKALIDDFYPESDEITFSSWIIYSLPGVALCILIGWFYLWMVYFKCSKSNHGIASKQAIQDVISKKYKALGPISCHEAEVIVLFLILVLLWIFRDPKFVSGWQNLIGFDKKIGDSVPAISIAFLLFFLPSDIKNLDSPPILDWKRAQSKMPWGVIILCGGGFALADAAQRSGLSKLVSQQLSSLQVLPPIAIVSIVCLMSTMLTEILMNTTTASILMPVFNQMALAIRVNPLFIMLPVAFACSYSFMLPVASPPNAIAFESGNMKTMEMAKPGFVMNVVCCVVQIFMLNTLGIAMFNLDSFPSWANSTELFDFHEKLKINNTF